MRRRPLLKMIARGALALALLAAVSMLIEHVLEARDTAKYAVHDSYVTVSGRRIRYLLEGADKPGPPVLLISGLCGSLEQWDDVQNTLARQSPVFTYDRAGMGFSDPSDAHDALREADELAAVLKAAKFTSKAVVASYSSGAFLARVFEAKYPEYVAALALVDPSTPGARDEQPPYRPLSYRRAFGRSFIRNTARALFGVARVQQAADALAAAGARVQALRAPGDRKCARAGRELSSLASSLGRRLGAGPFERPNQDFGSPGARTGRRAHYTNTSQRPLHVRPTTRHRTELRAANVSLHRRRSAHCLALRGFGRCHGFIHCGYATASARCCGSVMPPSGRFRRGRARAIDTRRFRTYDASTQ